MKRLTYLILLTLVLVSCGTDGSHFRIDGRLLNSNQGKLFVYSPDALIPAIDTIDIAAGRFSKEFPCTEEGTLVIVFPNNSEYVVFAKPGKTADLNGDFNQLKDLEITGTNENKLMNKFREAIKDAGTKEIEKQVTQFVQDNPTSIVSVYLVNKYLTQTPEPNYKEASRLLDILRKAQPGNGRLALMAEAVKQQSNASIGNALPSFSVVDINNKKVTQADLSKGDAVIYLWASWEYETCNTQRQLHSLCKDHDLTILGICIDLSEKECRKVLKRDDITTSVVCEGNMYDSPLVKALGLSSLPDNIVLKNGKIVDRNLTTQELRERFN